MEEAALPPSPENSLVFQDRKKPWGPLILNPSVCISRGLYRKGNSPPK